MAKVGDVFNKITIIKRMDYKDIKGNTLFLCQCECGKELILPSYRFGLKKAIYSCGCSDRRKTAGGQYKHPLYKIWRDIKSRCYYTKDVQYKHYGGRGIRMCEEWKTNFILFYNWSLQNGWCNGLTIDRIDTNKNYEPSNCRWVNWITQNNNRRNNRILTYKEETHTVAEWSRLLNIKHSTILERLKRGWSVEEALTISSNGKHKKKTI